MSRFRRGLWAGWAGLALLGQPLMSTDEEPALAPGAEQIRGIVIVPSIEQVDVLGLTGAPGVTIQGPEFLQQRSFEALLESYLGQSLTESRLTEIQVEIVRYCRGQGRLIVDVFYPEQDILEGTIQIAVIEGRVGEVTVENDGRKWFSDNYVLRRIRLGSGDTILASRIEADLHALNRNTYPSLTHFSGSFLEATAAFRQGAVGETDVEIEVNDRMPFRPFVGGENTGFTVLGQERLFAGLHWANAMFLGHRMSYKYETDFELEKYNAHLGSYAVPLPWRHELLLFGGYVNLNPDYGLISPGFEAFSSKGSFWQTSARYVAPILRTRVVEHELVAGFDFKRTDTPLLFQQPDLSTLLATNLIEVAQFSLEYRGLIRDRWGGTGLSISGVYSPGELTEHNTDEAFSAFAPGTQAEYAYGRAELERETRLPADSSLYLRAAGQYATDRLTPSETFGLGGFRAPRGYFERTVVGDLGWLVSGELRSPVLRLGFQRQDRLQLLAFADYGGNINNRRQPGDRYGDVLLSVGGGLRYTIRAQGMSDLLAVRLDYGYQLAREYLNDPEQLESQPHGRVHFGVELGL